MALISIFLLVLAAGVSAVFLFFFYQTRKFGKYFKERGVPLMGSEFLRLFRFLSGKISFDQLEVGLYENAVKVSEAAKSPVAGFVDSFVTPAYYVTDLDLARNIYVKDFSHFVNRRKFTTENSDRLFQKMLFFLESEHWKETRSKLSPTFTTGKIRRMFGIFDKSSERMCDFLRKNLGPDGDSNLSEAYSKYAMDVIASCAFGVESKSFEFQSGSLSEFETMGQGLQFQLKPAVFLKFLFRMIAPKASDVLGLEVFDITPQLYFLNVIKSVMKHRRETGERQEDFLQLMMDVQTGLLKKEENSKETLEVMAGTEEAGGHFSAGEAKMSFDDDDIAANCVLFLIGGFDTTQSLLIFATYQLALGQEVQERLLREVEDSMERNGGKLTYESVQEMSYMDMFINETLRYHPPQMRLERACTKDYKIPGTDMMIAKGNLVSLPVIGLHRDPKFYENPEKFDPERFLPERKNDRHPYTFSPFGHGPRNCIGMRFALTKVKAVIATIVYNFRLEPSSRTEIPIQLGNQTTMKPKNNVWLKLTPRQKN